MSENNLHPLNVYVFYTETPNEDYDIAPREFANTLFSTWFNDIEDTFSREIGVPVYPICQPKVAQRIIKEAGAKAAHNVFFLLVDEIMLEEAEWSNIIDDLVTKYQKEENCLIVPVAFSPRTYELHEGLYDEEIVCPSDELVEYLLQCTDKLYQFLRKITKGDEKEATSIFLSHAKGRENVKLLENLKLAIDGRYGLDTVFRMKDIEEGDKFQLELKEKKGNAILLAFQMDRYASKEWCQKEFTLAKKYDCPIVVYNILKDGEKRSFPYMGNVKTVLIEDKGNDGIDGNPNIPAISKIVLHTLLEAVYCTYQQLLCKCLIPYYPSLEGKRVKILLRPPELYTMVLSEEKDVIMLYADPPLGETESKALEALKQNNKYLTPNLLPCFEDGEVKKFLKGKKIGFSLSNAGDIDSYGLRQAHLAVCVQELARYLFTAGAKVAYGGLLDYAVYEGKNKINFTLKLVELARSVREQFIGEEAEIINFRIMSSPPKKTGEEMDIEYQGELDFRNIYPSTDEGLKCDISNSMGNEELWQAFYFAENLSKMREVMAKEIHACVLLGGKTEEYQGRIPGIVEEALNSLEEKNPIYLVGGFGGAARFVIECLTGKPLGKVAVEITPNDDFEKFYIDKTNVYGKRSLAVATKQLKELSLENLNNGLDTQDNERLFTSTNISEIIRLILKGLKNIPI